MEGEPPSPGHTSNSVPVQTKGDRSDTNPIGGVAIVRHASVVGSYAEPDETSRLPSGLSPPITSIAAPVHATSGCTRSARSGHEARLRHVDEAGSYADTSCRGAVVAASIPPAMIASRPVQTTSERYVGPRGSGGIGDHSASVGAVVVDAAAVVGAAVDAAAVVGAGPLAVVRAPTSGAAPGREREAQMATSMARTRPVDTVTSPARRRIWRVRSRRTARLTTATGSVTGSWSSDERWWRSSCSMLFMTAPDPRARAGVAPALATTATSLCLPTCPSRRRCPPP